MYESQINNTHPDPQKTGSLYGMSKVLKQHAKDYEFWTQHIICRGNHVIFKVNDKVVVDYVDKKNSFKKGHPALQQHDPGSMVYCKDLKVWLIAKKLQHQPDAPARKKRRNSRASLALRVSVRCVKLDRERYTTA